MVVVRALVVGLLTYGLVAHAQIKLPRYITPCRRNDPKLDECVVKQGTAAIPKFIHGDPKYRVPNLDPLDIEEIRVRQGTRQVGLSLILKPCKLYGMGSAKFTKSRTDLKKRHVEWDFVNDKGVKVIGDYTISGQVLLLPITGAGKANITLEKLTALYKYDFDLIKRDDGKEYMNFTTSKMLFNVKSAHFQLDNLFNGDRLLGDNMNRLLNENWKELVEEFGPALSDALAEVFRRLLTSIHAQVPFDVVYPDGP